MTEYLPPKGAVLADWARPIYGRKDHCWPSGRLTALCGRAFERDRTTVRLKWADHDVICLTCVRLARQRGIFVEVGRDAYQAVARALEPMRWADVVDELLWLDDAGMLSRTIEAEG